jgi:hypothetical protein
LSPVRRIQEKLVSGDGKIVATRGQTGRLCEASGYLALNNG